MKECVKPDDAAGDVAHAAYADCKKKAWLDDTLSLVATWGAVGLGAATFIYNVSQRNFSPIAIISPFVAAGAFYVMVKVVQCYVGGSNVPKCLLGGLIPQPLKDAADAVVDAVGDVVETVDDALNNPSPATNKKVRTFWSFLDIFRGKETRTPKEIAIASCNKISGMVWDVGKGGCFNVAELQAEREKKNAAINAERAGEIDQCDRLGIGCEALSIKIAAEKATYEAMVRNQAEIARVEAANAAKAAAASKKKTVTRFGGAFETTPPPGFGGGF